MGLFGRRMQPTLVPAFDGLAPLPGKKSLAWQTNEDSAGICETACCCGPVATKVAKAIDALRVHSQKAPSKAVQGVKTAVHWLRKLRARPVRQDAVVSSHIAEEREVSLSAEEIEGIEQAVLQRRLLSVVYDQDLDQQALDAALQACPELGWLASCIKKCPLPQGWKRLRSKQKVQEGIRFSCKSTGEVTFLPPRYESFVLMARLAAYARLQPAYIPVATTIIQQTCSELLAEASDASEGWAGPWKDPATGREYYHHAPSKTSSWHAPAAVPAFLACVARRLLASELFAAPDHDLRAAAVADRTMLPASSGDAAQAQFVTSMSGATTCLPAMPVIECSSQPDQVTPMPPPPSAAHIVTNFHSSFCVGSLAESSPIPGAVDDDAVSPETSSCVPKGAERDLGRSPESAGFVCKKLAGTCTDERLDRVILNEHKEPLDHAAKLGTSEPCSAEKEPKPSAGTPLSLPAVPDPVQHVAVPGMLERFPSECGSDASASTAATKCEAPLPRRLPHGLAPLPLPRIVAAHLTGPGSARSARSANKDFLPPPRSARTSKFLE